MALPAPSPQSAALITGASSGIGADLARELAGRGYNVVLVARREDRLRALAAELGGAHGIRAEVLACDLDDPAARDALAGRVGSLGLTVDVLVNNAGYGTTGQFVTLDGAREAAMVRLNCEAVVALSSAYAPEMAARGRGAILITGSSAGFQPLPGQAAYSASKAFANTFAEALHTELAPSNVTVTVLCPGPVETEFAEVADADGLFERAPGFAKVSARECARQAVDGLAGGRRVVTPGLAIKTVGIAARYTPRSVLLPMLRRFYPS